MRTSRKNSGSSTASGSSASSHPHPQHHGHGHPLPKGSACSTCKARKVRCSAGFPACDACQRSARFEGKDPKLVVCQYNGMKCGVKVKNPKRRSLSESHDEDEGHKSEPEEVRTAEDQLESFMKWIEDIPTPSVLTLPPLPTVADKTFAAPLYSTSMPILSPTNYSFFTPIANATSSYSFDESSASVSASMTPSTSSYYSPEPASLPSWTPNSSLASSTVNSLSSSPMSFLPLVDPYFDNQLIPWDDSTTVFPTLEGDFVGAPYGMESEDWMAGENMNGLFFPLPTMEPGTFHPTHWGAQ